MKPQVGQVWYKDSDVHSIEVLVTGVEKLSGANGRPDRLVVHAAWGIWWSGNAEEFPPPGYELIGDLGKSKRLKGW